MPQTMEHDTWELRGCILPFEELFTDEHRLHRQTVGQTEQHSAVTVACGVFPPVRVRISTDRTGYTNFFRGKMRFLRAAGLEKTIVIFCEE